MLDIPLHYAGIKMSRNPVFGATIWRYNASFVNKMYCFHCGKRRDISLRRHIRSAPGLTHSHFIWKRVGGPITYYLPTLLCLASFVSRGIIGVHCVSDTLEPERMIRRCCKPERNSLPNGYHSLFVFCRSQLRVWSQKWQSWVLCFHGLPYLFRSVSR
jgi:hypothetical protein